jgi:zinc protease
MPNGVHVLLAERHDLPIVSVRVASAVGAGDLPGARAGVVAFMGSMLEQGAGKRDALALSDEFEALGADHGAWCDWDSCGVRVKVLASRLPAAMDLLADVALRPTFPDAEFERLHKRMLGFLQQEKSSPGAMEQNALAAAVFGRAHPYGHSLHGSLADVEKLNRGDVERAYKGVFAPKSTTIVAAGDVTAADLKALLDARFGSWKAAATPAQRLPPAVHAKARVVLVDAPGAAQSQVFLADEGAPESTPDRIPLGVMNAILGGMFSSRINLDLREAHAYTYGAHSRFGMRHGAGPFVAGGAIFAAHTVDAVKELLAQVTRIRDEPVTDQELADAKENAKLALPARFESVDEVTGALADVAVYGLPLDEYATRTARIDAVTAADVQRVAKKWLHPAALRIVVTGDREKLESGLSALGSVEVRDAYGDLATEVRQAKRP